MADWPNRFVTLIANSIRLAHDTNFRLRSNRFMRFMAAGSLNTLFGFVVYSASIVAGAAVWRALMAGMVLGTAFNFFTTGGYVFRELSLRRFPRFLFFYLVVFGVNLELIELLSMWLNNKILSQAIITFPMAFLSYFLMARFVFSSKKW